MYNLLQRLEYLNLGDNQVVIKTRKTFLDLIIMREKPVFFYSKQLKYLEKGEFRDLNFIKSIKLGGNQLSVIIDNLFETQKYLEYLGNKWMMMPYGYTRA